MRRKYGDGAYFCQSLCRIRVGRLLQRVLAGARYDLIPFKVAQIPMTGHDCENFERICTAETIIANLLWFATFARTIPMHIPECILQP